MKNVAIIIPYFGKLPCNMITFLESCRFNEKLDWFIFTDQDMSNIDIPKNVHIIKDSFNNMKRRIENAVKLDNIVLNKPYKLCDYKPVYGIAFQDYISDYKYWGYSDIDVVYGDLWKYISYGFTHNYDRIGGLGHFTLFRNKEEINNRYRLPIKKNGEKKYLFLDAFRTSKTCHFDETWGINIIYDQYNFSIYKNENLVNEPFPENMDLISIDRRFTNLPQVYIFFNGHCLFFYKKNKQIYKLEFGYFHFQKRLFTEYLKKPCNKFYIDSKGYHQLNNLDNDTVNSLIDARSPFIKRVGYMMYAYHRTSWFTDRRIFSYYLPVKHIYNRLFKEKNFFI